MARRGSKKIADWVSVVSSALTALTVLLAGAKYLFGFFSPITLHIELPPVIEFRCSGVDFSGYKCLNSRQAYLYHLTITAALNLRADGDASKEAMITRASARLRTGTNAQQYVLTGLWSADFVPGQPFRRQQITVSSLKGGESRSQEMWFFSLAERCDNMRLVDCEGKERANFLIWQRFITGIRMVDSTLPLRQTAYVVEFEFEYKEGEKKTRTRGIACHVEISNTVRRLATAENYEDKGVLSVSAPCLDPTVVTKKAPKTALLLLGIP